MKYATPEKKPDDDIFTKTDDDAWRKKKEKKPNIMKSPSFSSPIQNR